MLQIGAPGDNPIIKSAGIPFATKPLPGPTTRGHVKLIGVKTMSLGTNHSVYCLEGSPYFRIRITCYKEDCLLCCPSTKVIKNYSKSFAALGGLHEDEPRDTSQATAPTDLKRFIKPPYSISKATSIDSDCCRLTRDQRSQQQSGQIKLQSVLIKSPIFSRPHVLKFCGARYYYIYRDKAEFYCLFFALACGDFWVGVCGEVFYMILGVGFS